MLSPQTRNRKAKLDTDAAKTALLSRADPGPASFWVATNNGQRPKPAIEVPVLCRFRKNGRLQLHLLMWLPETHKENMWAEGVWVDAAWEGVYTEAEVVFYMDLKMPVEVK